MAYLTNFFADRYYAPLKMVKNESFSEQTTAESLTALQQALAMGIHYSSFPGHTPEMVQAMYNALSDKWGNLRRISFVSVVINSVTASAKDKEMLKKLQKSVVVRNPNMGAAHIIMAQAETMKAAAANENGVMMGFIGMNMAQTIIG